MKVNNGTANGTVITGTVTVGSSASDPNSVNNTARDIVKMHAKKAEVYTAWIVAVAMTSSLADECDSNLHTRSGDDTSLNGQFQSGG